MSGRGAAEREAPPASPDPLGSPGNSPRAPGGGEPVGRPAGASPGRGAPRGRTPPGSTRRGLRQGTPAPTPAQDGPRPTSADARTQASSYAPRGRPPAAPHHAPARPGSRRRRRCQCPRSRRVGPAHCAAAAARCSRPRRLRPPRGLFPWGPRRLPTAQAGTRRTLAPDPADGWGGAGSGRPGVRGCGRWVREVLRWGLALREDSQPQPEGPGAPELSRAGSWTREDPEQVGVPPGSAARD